MEDIQKSLLSFITRSFMVDEDEIDLDKSMIDEGIIDSFGLVEIAAFLEKQFSIKISQDDMIRENFGSVLKIVAFVERRMKQ
jgi:acyl carrier protein